ncbi:MAG: chorismate synthase [Clostridia bacterium]|nr:chorismate synthase [Clostridia bacterium]MBQ8926248.1 chorismate synthase [Clostridia bacterium]
MSSNIGTTLNVSVFGQSHGKAIGVTVDGLPSGERIDVDELQAFLDRRRPGTSELTTARNETDCPEFLSGVTEDKDGTLTTCGFPLTAVIQNKDQHSSDYSELLNKPRPSHADYTAFLKYGDARDMRGGGHFSGRLTAPLCIAGGICLQMLERRGILIGAHLERVGEVLDEPFPLHPDKALFEDVRSRNPATVDPSASLRMIDEITNAKLDSDSVGGIVECAVTGFPAGVGGPMFDGIESELAKALFGIPAVKGVEFGNGFTAAELRGSQNNDAFIAEDGTVKTETNRSGGIQGGISNGMPLLFRVAIKPTPSIAKAQKTVDLSTMEETELVIHGRHDPCIAVRAVPVVEAVAAIALTDLLLGENKL